MLQLLRNFIYSTHKLSLVNTVNFITFDYELFMYRRFRHLYLIVNIMSNNIKSNCQQQITLPTSKILCITPLHVLTAKFTSMSINLL